MSTLVETLYYQTYNYFLLDDLKNAKMYLTFLREEYEKDFDSFEVLKKDNRFEFLVKLGDAIDNNKKLNFEIEKPKVSKVLRDEEDTIFRTQNELTKAIFLSLDNLRICLGVDSSFNIRSTEEETRFGRVDVVAIDKDTIYPIELKKSEAKHDCIGQISKYILHYRLGLINKIYNNVLGILISNSFDEYTLRELYKLGVIAIKYKFRTNEIVEFSKV